MASECGPKDCWNASVDSNNRWPIAIYAGGDKRIGIGPGLRRGEVGELGDYQAAAEPGGARVVAVDRRERTRQQESAVIAQLRESGQMRRPRSHARDETLGVIQGVDCVPHGGELRLRIEAMITELAAPNAQMQLWNLRKL